MTFSKYEQNGAYHWSRTLEASFRDYNPRLAARYELTVRLLRQHCELNTATGLDIGCGDGVLLEYLSRGDIDAYGLDPSAEGLHLYREFAEEDCSPVVQADAFHLPFDSTFDFVTMVEVIEHIEQPRKLLNEVRSVLHPEGVVILTTPQRQQGGTLHDPEFHHQEFTAEEFKCVLEDVFDDVEVLGYSPEWIDNLYVENQIIRPLSLLFRGAFKTAGWFGINPYVKFGVGEPTQPHDNLIAVGKI